MSKKHPPTSDSPVEGVKPAKGPRVARRSLLRGLVTGTAGATVLAAGEAQASGYFNLGGFWRRHQASNYILADTANLNLFDAAGRPIEPVDLVFEIIPGVTVYSTSASTPALVTGAFPAGSTIKLINRGQIIGAGGNGASINAEFVSIPPGAGGTALALNYPLTVDNGGGYILGGGGGGGLGGSGGEYCLSGGGAGGGGAGRVGGVGGPATAWGGGAGDNGSTVGGAGGAGSPGYGGRGGTGGNYGSPGQQGAAGNPATCGLPTEVGAAGAAVRRNGHALTWLAGDTAPNRLGPIV